MNLYEIMYTKTMLNLDGTSVYTQTKTYQIVAPSELNAAVRLGQIFYKDDEYEIEIKSIKKVLSGETK